MYKSSLFDSTLFIREKIICYHINTKKFKRLLQLQTCVSLPSSFLSLLGSLPLKIRKSGESCSRQTQIIKMKYSVPSIVSSAAAAVSSAAVFHASSAAAAASSVAISRASSAAVGSSIIAAASSAASSALHSASSRVSSALSSPTAVTSASVSRAASATSSRPAQFTGGADTLSAEGMTGVVMGIIGVAAWML